MIRFTANLVTVDDSDDEFIVVGFADEQAGECREALHFQRSHTFGEQDVALGMDSAYIERSGQSRGGYGGFERVELHSDRLYIAVRGPVAERMSDTEFEIGLSLSLDECEQLRQGLRSVFTGFEFFTELDDVQST